MFFPSKYFSLGLDQKLSQRKMFCWFGRIALSPVSSWDTAFCEMQNRYSVDSAELGFISTIIDHKLARQNCNFYIQRINSSTNLSVVETQK